MEWSDRRKSDRSLTNQLFFYQLRRPYLEVYYHSVRSVIYCSNINNNITCEMSTLIVELTDTCQQGDTFPVNSCCFNRVNPFIHYCNHVVTKFNARVIYTYGI